MKKIIIKTSLIALTVVAGICLFFWNQRLVKKSPEARCLAAGGGWAPYWDLKDCNGNLLKHDSVLVFNEKTCWCHATNTCWDGKECIARQKIQDNEK